MQQQSVQPLDQHFHVAGVGRNTASIRGASVAFHDEGLRRAGTKWCSDETAGR